MADLDIWRPLIQKLKSIAKDSDGPHKPTCSGGRANSPRLEARITWKGDQPQEHGTDPSQHTGYMFRLDPSNIPPGSISSIYSLTETRYYIISTLR